MPNVTTTAKGKPATNEAPRLEESMRRLLADPYSLGDQPAAWERPAVPPETSKLRTAENELVRGLQAATRTHMHWCVKKLFALPAGNREAEDIAFAADNFIDACGDFPDDLWTMATLELLKTKTFRPAPAELVAIAGPRAAERRRMLDRVRLMLHGPATAIEAPKPFQREPADVRLRTLRDSLRKVGQVHRAAKYERELAELEQRAPEAWAKVDMGNPMSSPAAPAPPAPAPLPQSPGTRAAMLRARARFWRTQPNGAAMADQCEAEAAAIIGDLEHRDEPVGEAA